MKHMIEIELLPLFNLFYLIVPFVVCGLFGTLVGILLGITIRIDYLGTFTTLGTMIGLGVYTLFYFDILVFI